MESINLCTFCARAVVRIDQFVVFCCWLVLFVCTWLLFSSLFDTCHAKKKSLGGGGGGGGGSPLTCVPSVRGQLCVLISLSCFVFD